MEEKEMIYKGRRFKKMTCPVCSAFSFSGPDELDLEDPDYSIDDELCFHCGWEYDLDQVDNPDLKTDRHEMSLNEYKEWYKNKIKENPDWDWSQENKPDPEPHLCPVCGKTTFPDIFSSEICEHCGWEDDITDPDDPDEESGANKGMTVIQAREQYKKWQEFIPGYQWLKYAKQRNRRVRNKKCSLCTYGVVVVKEDKYFEDTDETIKKGTEGIIADVTKSPDGEEVCLVEIWDWTKKKVVYPFLSEELYERDED